MGGANGDLWWHAVQTIVQAALNGDDGTDHEYAVRYLIQRELITREELDRLPPRRIEGLVRERAAVRAPRSRRGAGQAPP